MVNKSDSTTTNKQTSTANESSILRTSDNAIALPKVAEAKVKFLSLSDQVLSKGPISEETTLSKPFSKKESTPSNFGGFSIYTDDVNDITSNESSFFGTGTSKAVDVFGVRIVPPLITFGNAFENQTYTETVSVQNISKNPVTLRIYNPRAWAFRITPIQRGFLLAPGLKITRNIHYTCSKIGIVHSALPIFVNEKCFELPLEAHKGQGFVEISPNSINFGRVDIGSKPVEKRLTIRNVSSCATKFLVDLGRNELDLQVAPLKGWIRPHSSVTIHLQLIALEMGELSSEIWVTTDLSQSRVNVTVEACRRSLIVLHPNSTSDFTLIEFPSTFFGCRRYQTVIVYNMAATSSAFVVLADLANQVSEPFSAAKNSGHEQARMFDVEPVQGRIRPFEGRIFTIWFQPQAPEEPKIGWKSQEIPRNRDFLCAIRIKRIQVDDYGASAEVQKTTNPCSQRVVKQNVSPSPNMNFLNKEEQVSREIPSMAIMDDISVLLCLYGEAVDAIVSVAPDKLYFPEAAVGKKEEKVIHITNRSLQNLAFRYNKMPYFEVNPCFKEIAPNTTIDVGIIHCARSLGISQKEIKFDIIAQTNHAGGKDIQIVNTLTVKIYSKIKSETVIPHPKFNPGITPKITHEVGFLTEQVTFNDKLKKPKCAMVSSLKKKDRPWLKSNAIIAFPNDMPKSLRSKPADKNTKTIFKGIERYVPPVDESVTYTLEQLLQKKANDQAVLGYLRGTAALATPRPKDQCCKLKPTKPDPDLKVVLDIKETSVPRDVLVPLTFVQLYRINVSPILISFGNVTTSKKCNQFLKIENNNNFKISAKILPLMSEIHIQILENFVIDAETEARVMLTFHREVLGRYSGTITCVINGFHSIDVAVVAEVVPKSLFVSPDRVEYRLPEAPFSPLFVPLEVQNPLNTPVSYSWSLLEGSPFRVEPTVGVAPKKGSVWCAAYFEPDSPNYKLHPLRLLVEGVACSKMKTGVLLNKPKVYFLENSLNVGYVPLNLLTVKRFSIFNPDFSDSLYVILNKEPVKGVTVFPSSGPIKARSCFSLALHICVKAEGPLDFVVYMNCQNSVTIEMRVTGIVVFPEVDMNPKYISLTRIYCNSVVKTPITAENKSKATAMVTFNMEEYPQFKVSLSKSFHDEGIPSKGFTLEPGVVQKFYLHFIPRDLASYDFTLPVIINNLIGDRTSASSKEMEMHTKKLKTYYRKATLTDTTGNKSIVFPLSEKVRVGYIIIIDVTVLKPYITISDLELKFEYNNQSKQFSVTNTSDEPTNLFFRFEESQSAFKIENHESKARERESSISSHLMPGELTTINVTFVSKTPDIYVLDINVSVSIHEHLTTYTSVRLHGEISPLTSIFASVSNVYFTQIPLNIDFVHLLHLTVNNARNPMDVLVYKEIIDLGKEVLTVDFPDGNMIKAHTKRKIAVKLTFNSGQTTSIRRQIIFRVEKFCECLVYVVVTADNCLLTTHAALRTHFPARQTLKESGDLLENKDSDLVTFSERQNIQTNHKLIKSTSHFKQEDGEGSSNHSSTSGLFSIVSSTLLKKTHRFSTMKIPLLPTEKIDSSDVALSLQINETDGQSNVEQDSVMIESFKKNEMDDSVFPMFPSEPAVTEYAVHMNRTRQAVQDWVYEQVFNCSYYPVLSSHAFTTFAQTNKDYGRTPPVAMRNVFDVLERICGRGVRRYFTPLERLPEEATAKAVFTQTIYKQLLDFLIAQGALLAHVEAKYLMGYDDYVMYCNANPSSHRSFDTYIDSLDSNTSETLNQESYKSFSVQCWLDVFLQIFKTLILIPLVASKQAVGKELEFSILKRSMWNVQIVELNKNVYSKAEEAILHWLTYIYNNQCPIIWPKQTPEPRNITNFESDLEDGLVLTAVTAAFCPYLSDLHFQDMFLQPQTVSQAYHNTICLVTAWERIRLGFTVTPRDFVRPNSVKMLMFVTHLYKVLPSYKPESTIKFTATLNSSESQVVTLENFEESAITYSVEIIPNTASFSLEESNTLVLKRKQKGRICVTYTARTAAKVQATLLVCGACMPPKFGRNYVFTLEGDPVKLPVTAVFNVVSPVNSASVTHLTLESPHTMEGRVGDTIDYEIYITYTEPQPGNLNALDWSRERKRKIPRRLFVLSEKLTVETDKRKKTGTLDIQVCCFSQAVHTYWLIFKNAEVGDFIVKLVISPGFPEPTLTLRAILEPESHCSCVEDTNFLCGRTVTINIPCRNLDQWASVHTMFELTISASEKEFWATYIESNIGFRLLQWMLEEKKEKLNEEIELLFKKSKTYKVTCKSEYVVLPPQLEISNVRDKHSIPLQVHVANNSPNHSTLLTLTSTDGQEIRCYKLNVICKY